MAEDILKRINEILEQGIKATGIDADPTDTSKYGFAPEHGSLIRELEELELLEELQELVGGEEKLGELIVSIAFKQEEVSPRYQTQEFQNFNVEGEPIGKRAYGITTAELQQKEIQDVIKNFIDTPTNVVGDADVYYHSRLGEIDNAQDIHFGTYDAALDRASLQYGKESVQSFYARALDEAYDLFREEVEALELVDDGSGNFKLPYKLEQFNFELENKAIPPKSQEWTFEYITEGETIKLNYIADDGFETLIDEFYVETIDYEGADVKKLGDLDVEDIIGSKKGFRELEGHIQALQEGQPVDVYKGKFDFGSKYNLYKTTIKPDAKVFDMSGQDIEITELVRRRGESELSPKTNTVSSEFLQYRLFGEDAPELRNISEIKIDNVSYKPKGNVFSSNDEIIKIISNNADVVAYTNEIEDAGSTSIYVRNADAVEVSLAGEQEITDFNKDVRKKYVETSVVDEQMNLIKAADRGDISTEELDELIEIRKPKLDTPTNVVDDAPLLETRFNYTSDVLDVPVGEIDEWADDVIKPNKVFNPDSFTRYTGEGEEYIWNRTTSFDAKELYERILKNRASDEDITKFFIYLASHSPSTAYAHKPYFQADALSDIVKIGIFSDKPITEVIPMGVFRDEAFFLDRLQSRNSELGPEINKVLVELVTEQGQFTNLKERMRNVIIDAHNEIYKNNPNDYFVLWRGGKLNRFYPWQSMSKSPSSAQAVSYQMNQLYGAGDTVETYLIHKNNMIDLDALGLSFSNEQEIIVLAEAANKPGAKLEQVLIQDDVDKINVSDLPKNGFEIDNITKPLADAGQASQEFFDDVIKGIDERYRPKSAYEQIIDLNNPDIYKWQDDYNKLVKEGGNFNQHIFTSIPTFYETQIIKGLALSNLLNKQPMPDNLLKGRYQVLDIGGTEGTWAKALAKNNPNLYVEVLDPLQKARDVFEEGELVTNAIFRNEAFSYVLDDQDKIFDAKGIQPVRFAVFNEADKYDVVHESMAFQFMDKNRAEQIKFIKENLLNENGIIIIEEKFANNDAIYKANEELKNTFKSKYYTPEQLQDKKFNVLLDMEANQVSVQEIEKILGENFANVQQYWDAGNFKGYIASDSDVVNQFVPEINNLEVSLTNHRFSTAPTEKEVKVAVQNKMQQGGTDSKLAAQLAQETVAKNPKLYNTLAKTLARFGVLGGTALAGLGKIAPALAPGDVAIEKAIEKAVPYLDDAASKLGFARLKFGNILPTYIAYEIGVALADVAQAALYADSSAYKYREGGAVYNELRQPELDATGKPVKVLGMSAYDYFQTPPGKKQLEEFDFGSQFMNELDQEKISKYSPGWGLTKGLMFLISEAYKSGTDQTTSDYTTKLKENPAMIYNAGFTGSNK